MEAVGRALDIARRSGVASRVASWGRRWYTPPSRRTWSKQHHRIRSPRPMVDRFDLSREQPHKEWWRERPVAPATFFGFPDVTKHGLRGGSLYVEQMDSVTLAVLADKCLKEKIWDPEIWMKFAWRAQQLASRTHEPDLCYLFRAFARADWFDQNLLTTYLGRIHRRLHGFQLADVTVVLEAFANPRFRQSTYLQKVFVHLALLLQHRDDATVGDLARCCVALQAVRPLSPELSNELTEALQLLAEALLLRDLSELNAARMVAAINSYVTWGLVSAECVAPSKASHDLCWALVRELRGQLRNHGRERPEDLAVLASALARGGLKHEALWEELVHNLEHEAHRLPGHAVASAVFGTAKSGRCTPQLYNALARRIREDHAQLSQKDCAHAAWGFLRGPPAIAQDVVLHGPIFERSFQLGLNTFHTEDLTMMLDGLSRTTATLSSVETMAAALLEAVHSRLDGFSAQQLASLVRSFTYLRPNAPDVLRAVVNAAQEAIAGVDGQLAVAPRHLAMLCQGIAGQPIEALPDAPARLEKLLPHILAALAMNPTAVSAAQLARSVGRYPMTPQHGVVLDACIAQLTARARNLSAPALVSLAVAISPAVGRLGDELAGGREGVANPARDIFFRELVHQLDMKRYDLAPGVLWRAARALEAVGTAFGEKIRLEPRDQPPSTS